MDEGRRNGLCFKCGQTFSPQHKCPDGHLHVLLLSDDEELGVEGDPPQSIEIQEVGGVDEEGECQILYLFRLSNTPNNTNPTLKLQGKLNDIPIQILVDSEASHNVISCKLVSKLGLSLLSFSKLHIRLGDGHRVWVQERCEHIDLQLGALSCNLDTLVFELGNLDMVLGIEWLKTLGEVIHNWKEQSMRFKQGERWVELKSGPTIEHLPMSFKGWIDKKKGGFLGQIGATEELCSTSNRNHNLMVV